MAKVINGTTMVPSLNGTLISKHDCTVATCSMRYAELLYIPSKAGNAVYLVLFVFLLLAQGGLGVRYRTWGFMVGLVCGLLLEIIGYAGRLMLHNNVFSFGSFVTYLVCLTIAPAFLSASIYSCISRLVIVYGRDRARLSPRVYTITFVLCDFISLLLQAAGGALAASGTPGSSEGQTGVNVMIAGLAFQVVSLTVFIALSLDLMLSVSRAGQIGLSHRFSGLRSRRMFRLFPWAIIFASIAIFVRCCFRVAELKNGFKGSLANNQTLFMIFEGPAIMLAVLTLTIFHPAICFGGRQAWQDTDWEWKTGMEKSNLSSENINIQVLAKNGAA
ncbi:RTA1-domain-containing protein [Myriangium duriaei CBS 260.36]|uniref:RTA1-domain-containing protein n=1 Tax=Myriangium duriaei CBS 260.36 TaxID=1168546 RepID=A0A9P4MCX8_9PEZI|nr:RTA1-domain-containing protein [Myriangium duriaei CBS 260.36]